MEPRPFQEYLSDASVPARLERFSLRGSPFLYIFLHLPKCGGTTIKYYLDAIEESFYVGRLVSFRAWSYQKREILDKLAGLKGQAIHALYGHTTFLGVHEAFPGLAPRYFTALREPVSCVLSGYRYLLGLRPDHPYGAFIHGIMGPEGLSFAAWHERFNWWNQMTYYLSRMYEGERVPSWGKSRIETTPLPPVTERDFDRARRLLDACFMVLDVDHLERDLARLLQHMGGPTSLAARPVQLNSSLIPYELSDADRALIAARNGWDARLYEHAKGYWTDSTGSSRP